MSGAIRHQYVKVNGCRFHVALSGPPLSHTSDNPSPGKAVFCLHGFPEGWQGWRPLMRAMPDVTFIAPDLRGYPSSELTQKGYDVLTLTQDIDLLIKAFNLDRPILLSHDWGGALGWIYAHRFPERISQLVVVNCPHPRTLVRAVLTFQDFQTLRIPWAPPFQIPFVPEFLLSTRFGRKLLELSFTLREGSKGRMDTDLVREIVNRFSDADKMRGSIEYYREFVKTLLNKNKRAHLKAIYNQPIQVPVSLIWGMEDRALSAKVAQTSGKDAGCHVEWRPLNNIGHFVDLEAPELLARELYRILASEEQPVKTVTPTRKRILTAA